MFETRVVPNQKPFSGIEWQKPEFSSFGENHIFLGYDQLGCPVWFWLRQYEDGHWIGYEYCFFNDHQAIGKVLGWGEGEYEFEPLGDYKEKQMELDDTYASSSSQFDRRDSQYRDLSLRTTNKGEK